MRLPLGARYSLVIVSLVLTVVVSMAAVLLLQFRSSATQITTLSTRVLDDELYRQVERRGQAVTQLLAEGLVTPLYRFDMQTMHELLTGALAQDEVLYALVHDEDGAIVHDGTLEIGDYGQPVAGLIDAIEARVGDDGRTTGVVRVSRPISIAGTRIGGVVLGLSLDGVDRQILGMREALAHVISDGTQRNLVGAVAVMVFFTIAGILLALAVSRSLVRPIRQLAQMATRVGTGDYRQEVVVGRSDEIGELASSFRDMSRSLAARTAEVSHLAYHDSLTDLANRAQLRGYLESAVARARKNRSLTALLFIDLDDFKQVNDCFGHDGGDALLMGFSERLHQCLRTDDKVLRGEDVADPPGELIARLGGDEFTIVLEDVHEPANAAAVARRILATLERPFVINERDATVSASIGITLCPDDGDGVNDLLRNADTAMYRAKQRGKNQYRFFDPRINAALIDGHDSVATAEAG